VIGIERDGALERRLRLLRERRLAEDVRVLSHAAIGVAEPVVIVGVGRLRLDGLLEETGGLFIVTGDERSPAGGEDLVRCRRDRRG
jgi:hypothetical protein